MENKHRKGSGKLLTLIGATGNNLKNVTVKFPLGKFISITGVSGSGKSTLGRCLLRLESSEGTVLYDNENLSNKSPAQLRPYRKNIQIVFQDPFSSLSPRMTVEQILLEGL